MTSDRWNTRGWNNRGKGGSESMRGLRTAQTSLSLSRSFSRILRALDFKEREMRRWVKKGSGIEKETMSSARRRILESISLPLADPLPAREENSGLWTRDINAFRSPDESRERCWCLKKKCVRDVHFEEYFYDIRCQEKCGDPSLNFNVPFHHPVFRYSIQRCDYLALISHKKREISRCWGGIDQVIFNFENRRDRSCLVDKTYS